MNTTRTVPHLGIGRRFAIVGSYVGVWICFYLLVHASSEGNQTAVQNSTIFVLLVEVIKVIVSVGLFGLQHGFGRLVAFLASHDLGLLCVSYMPVALLYAIYNNLMFLNVKANSPTAYLILSSSRLLMTALVWQLVLNVDIPAVRRVSLFVISAGIVVKGWPSTEETKEEEHGDLHGILFVVLQMSCSVLASVYNEILLKKNSFSPHLQNLCLYLDSVAANIFIGVIVGVRKSEEFNLLEDLQLFLSPVNIAIVLTLATAGIMSSMVLRYENSVTKGVASASETIFTPIAQYVFLGSTFVTSEVVAATLVGFGTVLYGCPVDSKRLLPTERNRKIPRSRRVRVFPFHVRFMLVVSALFSFRAIFTTLQLSQSSSDWLPGDRSFDPPTNEVGAPMCTESGVMSQSRPHGVRAIKYKRILHSHRVISFIVGKLDELGIPVTIMYGTLLHEYRNGTGSCVLPRWSDKDLDIAVFSRHIPLILDMDEEIRKKFRWTVGGSQSAEGYLQILPLDDQRRNKGMPNQVSFQIDVYGFSCDEARGLLNFEWDKVVVSMDGFLPLRRHKTVMEHASHLHIPIDPPCLLSNMYGSDYMTPKTGHFIRKKAHDDPKCHATLDSTQQKDLQRQLGFCKPVEGKVRDDVNQETENIQSSGNVVDSDATRGKVNSGLMACIRCVFSRAFGERNAIMLQHSELLMTLVSAAGQRTMLHMPWRLPAACTV